jgi:prevent-host-death family protein
MAEAHRLEESFVLSAQRQTMRPQTLREFQVLEKGATGSYNYAMATVSIKDAKNRLTELARRVEEGETIVVTRNGKPVLDLVPHRKKGGVDFEAGRAYLHSLGIKDPFPYIADDFDDPLPEDFLIGPLPFD